MEYVIVDTSSIVFGFEFKKDVFEAATGRFHTHKQLISAGVLAELSTLAENRGKKGLAARLALAAIKYKKVLVDNSTQHVDSWVFGKSLEHPGTVVITNDTALFKRLKAKGVLAYKFTKAGVIK